MSDRDTEQLALFLNGRDTAETGTASWDHLPIDARHSYLKDAEAILGAVRLLGWAKVEPLAADEREALAAALYDLDPVTFPVHPLGDGTYDDREEYPWGEFVTHDPESAEAYRADADRLAAAGVRLHEQVADLTAVERFADLAAAQFSSDLDYDGAEVIRRIEMTAHIIAPDHPRVAADCPVCVDDDRLDATEAGS